MWKDFKEFISQGNVIDLAVAVIIGTAFSKIVSSLVEDIVMPLAGVLLNGIHFEHLVYRLNGVDVTYGVFIQSIVDFLIIAVSIFLVLRFIIRRKKEEEPEEEVEEVDSKEQLLIEIRDLLKEKQV